MSLFNIFHKHKQKTSYQNMKVGGTYLSQIVPNKGWELKEDYVELLDRDIKGSVIAPVLVYIKPNKADLDNEWGVNYIQDLVSDTVKNSGNAHNMNVMFIENIRPMTKDWIDHKQKDADRYSSKGGHDNKQLAHARKQTKDLSQIADELEGNASYLAIGMKYVVAAESQKVLDEFLESLQRRLELRVPGTVLTLSNGNIDKEFANLFNNPMDEPGKKMMFTSTEFAGSYNIVTNGIEDPNGVYVGEQIGDISNAAVIWDMNDFEHFAVMASGNDFARKRDFRRDGTPEEFRHWRGSDLWLNTLILQLVKEQPLTGRSHHIFTLALDPIHLDDHLLTSTAEIDLNKGRINPFEMFGDQKDELDIFPANISKWNAMTRQLATETIKDEQATYREPLTMTEQSDLDQILEQFYIDHHMWVKNAKENRDKLRIVGVPSADVPRLRQFVVYLANAYEDNTDPNKAAELQDLLALFRQLRVTNGDLFDTVTDPMFAILGTKRHTLLDYSNLSQRKGNILLVQLLNSISAITNQTKAGDTVIIHGAQRITSLTQKYITSIINDLYNKHVRVVFSYNSSADMLDQVEFNHMSDANWVLTGRLSADQAAKYNKILGNQRQMTPMISRNIQSGNNACYYLRRGNDNVIFEANPAL